MDVKTAELLFIGLPETGKTTFFVALDEVIQRQTNRHGLSSDGFAKNRNFIESAKKLWRAGKSVQRTLSTANDSVELLVQHAITNTKARLTAPDLSGEFFDAQWTDRKWPVSFRLRVDSVSGLFVFINAAHNGRNSAIEAAWLNQVAGASNGQSKPWTFADAAKQVKLVELLQFASERANAQKPMPLAVMISAWDLIEKEKQPTTLPEAYLESEWSLLNQYLLANPETFKSKVYGISARGGDDSEQAALSHFNPHERVWLKDGGEVTKDLTRPLRWLLGLT